ncbi:hypothetical protein EVG20_g7392 [Dentipellis fragilis]|uniref:Aminotransferase class I/classII large domain-containing protein n=1 Tax=Dentipellis fragilis TaxID=205917 RepID=A0A4Y9YG17_9AGAM|nr:hypothetical protein EVG20_g7392 [Dentipellis fragilis]
MRLGPLASLLPSLPCWEVLCRINQGIQTNWARLRSTLHAASYPQLGAECEYTSGIAAQLEFAVIVHACDAPAAARRGPIVSSHDMRRLVISGAQMGLRSESAGWSLGLLIMRNRDCRPGLISEACTHCAPADNLCRTPALVFLSFLSSLSLSRILAVNPESQDDVRETKQGDRPLAPPLRCLARARQLSPLKGLQKYFTGNAIPLAGGMPSPAYFPFANISADALVSDSFPLVAPSTDANTSSFAWLWRLFGASDKGEHTTRITIPKEPSAGDNGLNLATALQYGPATGLAPLQKFIQEFSEQVYHPAFSDCTTMLHTGNTDGWSKAVGTLCNRGDTIIAEEWTYPSAVASVRPFGVGVMPVQMDGEGMRADSLRTLLAQWDESKGKRPHVMYTVPVGQNPSGATMGIQRKREIYDVCVEYDVIIVEDDPYFFLQVGPYVPKSERVAEPNLPAGDEVKQFINSLAPSFLKIDYQGRVIRLDTFSKTIAPGVRLGWFTANTMFIERLERHAETTTQAPCGLGQSLVTKLLQSWAYEGYIRWLRGLRIQYKARRDLFVDLLSEEFDLQRAVGTHELGAWHGQTVYTAYVKQRGGALWGSRSEKASVGLGGPLFSFVPPSSGMFVWVKVHFKERAASANANGPVGEDTLEMKLWIKLAEAGVLMAPGWFFAADTDEDRIPADPNVEGHLRISFSNADFADMRKAVGIFSKTLKKFFEDSI